MDGWVDWWMGGQTDVWWMWICNISGAYLPSEVILISDISAGVPTKAPVAPANTAILILPNRFGGLPVLLKSEHMSYTIRIREAHVNGGSTAHA